jgi:hypothetical protein
MSTRLRRDLVQQKYGVLGCLFAQCVVMYMHLHYAVSCPVDCGEHGECLSMRQHAARFDKGLQDVPYYDYAANWDADMIYGCSCDSGYSGWRCQERTCPTGDDPLTVGQFDEVQLIRCDYSGADTTNRFTLSFENAVTRPFAPSARAELLKLLLEELPTVNEVSVSYSSGFSFCDNANAPAVPASQNIIAVTFISQHGDVSRLVVLDDHGQTLTGLLDNIIDVSSDGESMSVTTSGGLYTLSSVTGNKENAPCSNRGQCDRTAGQCKCFPGFQSSDGKGRPGRLGDCGFVSMPITICPSKHGVECSGNGLCTGSPEYTCDCLEGWQGGDCAERSCPVSIAWFDFPSADNIAHAPAECSNRGACNRLTGECQCQDMFTGSACERMVCPSATDRQCSGHGRCLPMSQLAYYAETNGDVTPHTYGEDPNNRQIWDGRTVFGCQCEAGFTGIDCNDRACPYGNDITLLEADMWIRDEVQVFTCEVLVGSVGTPSFKLRFRKEETSAIPASADVDSLSAALSSLSSVVGVSIAFTGGLTACSASPGTTWSVTFTNVGGDIPPMQVVMDTATLNEDGTYNAGDGWTATQLQFTGGDILSAYSTPLTYIRGPSTGFTASGIRSQETVKGTSGHAECSDRGLCNRKLGRCECFNGFGSSDGGRQPGGLEDCGWREEFQFRWGERRGERGESRRELGEFRDRGEFRGHGQHHAFRGAYDRI